MSPHQKENERIKQYAEWLSTLKVGDRVCYFERSGWARDSKYRILTIERMTATQAVCAGNTRFRLKDGNVIGVDYRKVEAVTDAVLKANDEAKLKEWFSSLQHQRTVPSIAVLRAMKEAAEAASKAEGGGAA